MLDTGFNLKHAPCMASPTLSAHEARRIAVEATTDPRTIQRYFSGGAVQSTTLLRIKSALAVLGIPDPQASPAASTEPADAA